MKPAGLKLVPIETKSVSKDVSHDCNFLLCSVNEMVDTLRESVWNKIDQEVTDERWNNIGFAAQAMVESEVPEQQILNMLIKYWDLQPSEAKDILRFAKKNSFRE